jgi:hypothetical protein
MRGTYKFKYFGILKKFNIEKINKDNFQILIDADIFDYKGTKPQKEYPNLRYKGIELDSSFSDFDIYFQFNKKEYFLKPEVLDHMFDRCESRCEDEDILDYKINEVDFNLNFQITYESKIKYLKHQIQSFSLAISEPQYYLLYTKINNALEYKTWFEFFYEEQIDNCEYEYVFKYLKGDKDFVPNFISEIWKEYFLVKGVTDYCKGKIEHLQFQSGLNEADIEITFQTVSAKTQNKEISTTNITPVTIQLKDRIFAESEYAFFQFIVDNYREKNNKAFFSYIYHYFSDNKLLIKNNKSSLLYNSFLVKNNYLSEFSKVIQRSQFDSGDEEKRLFTIFDNFRDSFIQKKMKEI